MADRKLSIDSQSSGASAGHQKKLTNLVIKKRLLKKQAPPFQILAAAASLETLGSTEKDELSRTQPKINTSRNQLLKIPMSNTGFDNNSFMSFTDQSDSDTSLMETRSNVEGFDNQLIMSSRLNNNTNSNTLTINQHQQHHHQNNKEKFQIQNQSQIKQINNYNNSLNSSVISGRASMGGTPMLQVSQQKSANEDPYLYTNNSNQAVIEQKKIFHPFAEKPSPIEEWKQVIQIFFATFFQFILWDIFGNIIYYVGNTFTYVFVFQPFLIAGIIGEYGRRCKNKCKRGTIDNNPFKRSQSKQSFFESDNPSQEKGDYFIVLDLDQTLVYTTIFKPDNMEDQNCLEVNNETQSLPVYVYKRPHLDQFLKEISIMGQIYVFTASTKVYADPIIDAIDPKGFIKGRFYRENCKLDKNGNYSKPMDIITKNMKKLIIVEDSQLVFNQYKNNTILIPEWNNDNKKDKGLLNVLNILEQLRLSGSKDISADLKTITEMIENYK